MIWMIRVQITETNKDNAAYTDSPLTLLVSLMQFVCSSSLLLVKTHNIVDMFCFRDPTNYNAYKEVVVPMKCK